MNLKFFKVRFRGWRHRQICITTCWGILNVEEFCLRLMGKNVENRPCFNARRATFQDQKSDFIKLCFQVRYRRHSTFLSCLLNISVSLWIFFPFFLQFPTIYSPLFDAIGAITEESCVCLEKLYRAEGKALFTRARLFESRLTWSRIRLSFY